MTCKQHNWKKIEEIELITWGARIAGKRILFQCQKCGALLKIRMSDNPDE